MGRNIERLNQQPLLCGPILKIRFFRQLGACLLIARTRIMATIDVRKTTIRVDVVIENLPQNTTDVKELAKMRFK